MSTYYLIPYESLPSAADSNMWYATWSTSNPIVAWSQTKPTLVPDEVSTFVVGVTCTAPPQPSGSTTLAEASPLKFPPSGGDALTATDLKSFGSKFGAWANEVKGVDIPDDAPLDERD